MGDLSTDIAGAFGKALVKELAKERASADIQRTLPNPDSKSTKLAQTLVGTAIDGLYDQVTKGGVSTATLQVTVFKAGAAITGLSDNDKVECASALLELGGAGLVMSRQVTVAAALEVGTGGAATPIVLMQAALFAKAAYDVANAVIKVNQQCGPLAASGYAEIEAKWSQAVGGLERAIQQNMTADPFAAGAGPY